MRPVKALPHRPLSYTRRSAMNIKALLWRVVYAVILVVVLAFVIPLLLQVVGMPMPTGPAMTLLRFALGALVILYVLFGPEPPALF
jgi:uncharacterized membrane protein YeaQ/YmgE (transglycosylase-associated protein family)